jgi:hypothetical protein
MERLAQIKLGSRYATSKGGLPWGGLSLVLFKVFFFPELVNDRI